MGRRRNPVFPNDTTVQKTLSLSRAKNRAHRSGGMPSRVGGGSFYKLSQPAGTTSTTRGINNAFLERDSNPRPTSSELVALPK